jgi:hypothetical protein
LTQRARSRTRDDARRGRSWQVPLSVAVIVISLIAIWRLSGGLFDDGPGGSILEVEGEADPEITAFWVDSGRELLTDWRMTSPSIVQDIATGSDCLPSVEFKAVACPDLPERYQGYRVALEALIARAAELERPSDSSADEWLTKLAAAWRALEESLGVYADVGLAGYAEEPWLEQQARYREEVIAGFDEAEFALARMLSEVDPEAVRTGTN